MGLLRARTSAPRGSASSPATLPQRTREYQHYHRSSCASLVPRPRLEARDRTAPRQHPCSVYQRAGALGRFRAVAKPSPDRSRRTDVLRAEERGTQDVGVVSAGLGAWPAGGNAGQCDPLGYKCRRLGCQNSLLKVRGCTESGLHELSCGARRRGGFAAVALLGKHCAASDLSDVALGHTRIQAPTPSREQRSHPRPCPSCTYPPRLLERRAPIR